MRTILQALIFFFLALGPAASWGPGAAFAEETATSSKFHVGVIIPLSGGLAEYGAAIRNGILLAQNNRAEQFKNIEFHFENSEYNASKAVSSFHKLLDIDKVRLVFSWGAPPSEAIAPIAEKKGIPLIAWSTDPTAALNRDFVIRFTNSAREYSQVLGEHLNKKGYQKIAVVLTENQYLNSLLQGLKKTLSKNQTLSVVDTYSFGDMDFRSSVTKLRQFKFDAIGVFLLSGQLSQFYRQLGQQKISIPSFGTDFFESRNEITQAKGHMEGAVYANNAVSNSFRKRYEHSFENDLQITHAGSAYDFASIVAELFGAPEKHTRLTAKQVLEAFRSNTAFTGVLGSYEYLAAENGDSYFKLPIVIKKIHGSSIQH